MKNFRHFICVLVVLVAAVCANAGVLDGYLVILHSNDVHGYCMTTEQNLGYSGFKFAKDSLKSKGADVFLFDAGDFSQGTLLVNTSHGADSVGFMNKAGYDAATLGNHEFDWGIDNLLSNAEKAEFKILCCNILRSSDKKCIFDPKTIFTVKSGKKIGVFGLETPECATKVHPDKTKGVEFLGEKDMYNVAQEQIDALKAENCALTVCLGHLGDAEETAPNRSVDLIANTKGLDLFVDGHSHTRIEHGSKEGNTLRVSTGEYSKALGYVVYKETEKGFEFVKCGLADADSMVYDIMTSGKSQSWDMKLKKEIDKKYDMLTSDLAKPFAENKVRLTGERNPGSRTEETNLGDLLADAMLWKGLEYDKDTDCAIINGGDIRTGIETGKISMKDLKTIMPFENQLCIITVKGSELLKALESATCVTPTEIGAFPQVAGIEMILNTKVKFELGEMYPESTYYAPKNPGSRVTIKTVGGKQFDPNALYKVATSDFLACGGDTYYPFRYAYRTACIDTGILLEDVACEYIEKALNNIVDEKYSKPQGRIEIIK